MICGGLTPLHHIIALVATLDGGTRRDRDFVRRLARVLHERADRLELPVVEAMGLTDVVATFSMEERVRLVVTGRPAAGPGEVTVRWYEREFAHVDLRLLAARRASPYLFATLDYRFRGRAGVLTCGVDDLPVGSRVRVRALATVGAVVQWRVSAERPSGGQVVEATVPEDGLALTEVSGDG